MQTSDIFVNCVTLCIYSRDDTHSNTLRIILLCHALIVCILNSVVYSIVYSIVQSIVLNVAHSYKCS